MQYSKGMNGEVYEGKRKVSGPHADTFAIKSVCKRNLRDDSINSLRDEIRILKQVCKHIYAHIPCLLAQDTLFIL